MQHVVFIESHQLSAVKIHIGWHGSSPSHCTWLDWFYGCHFYEDSMFPFFLKSPSMFSVNNTLVHTFSRGNIHEDKN
jgi:hypothetical protein